jgi:hypothetical protein
MTLHLLAIKWAAQRLFAAGLPEINHLGAVCNCA